MASVYLRFIPPDRDDLVSLSIYEAPTPTGVLTLVETVNAIGAYPNYIDEYTTNLATSAADWFAIQWQNAKGAVTDMSPLVQGGMETLVAAISDRVMLRDSSLNEIIVAQEAEAVVADFFATALPYSINVTQATAMQISGLVKLTLARSYMIRTITNAQANKWTAGLVSMDQSVSASAWKNIEELIRLANKDLGRNYTTVLLLKELPVAGGFTRLTGVDVSRSLVQFEIQ